MGVHRYHENRVMSKWDVRPCPWPRPCHLRRWPCHLKSYLQSATNMIKWCELQQEKPSAWISLVLLTRYILN